MAILSRKPVETDPEEEEGVENGLSQRYGNADGAVRGM